MRDDLKLWERELGTWTWHHTLIVVAALAAGPVGWYIGTLL